MAEDLTFSLLELSTMRQTEEASMLDQCQILIYGESKNAIGEVVKGWVEQPAIPCGFSLTQSQPQERTGENLETGIFSAKLRLPFGTSITYKDRVKITKRLGQVINPVIYSVVSIPNPGNLSLIVNLKGVTSGNS